jgi:PEP-CTERM motif
VVGLATEQLERLMKAKMYCQGASRIVMALAIGAGLVVSAKAETLLVDFGNASSFRGVTVPNPDPKGHYWNSLQPGPFYPSLIDINNAVTSIGLGYTTGVGTDSYNGPAGPTSIPPTAAEIAGTDIDTVALGDLGVKEAAIDFAASPGGLDNRTRFAISGLNPNELYSMKIYGSHKFSDDDNTVYSIFSDATYTTQVATANLNVQTPGSPNLHNRDQTVTISNVLPQAGNTLYMQFVGSNGNLGYLNSFELTGVPEPSSLLLVICGGAASLVGWRRRS